jgi:hypothetical protein
MLSCKMPLSRATVLLGGALVVASCPAWSQDTNTSPSPVLSAKQAREIGESALVRKYEKVVRVERPFNAKLVAGVWCRSPT